MIESCDRHLPADVALWVYAEGFTPETPSERVIAVDLLQSCPDLVAFKERHGDNLRARGEERRGKRPWVRVKWNRPNSRLPKVKLKWIDWGIGYRWDAVRFSHKCFAIFDAAKRSGADVLCWMDADIVVFQDIPRSFIEGLVPSPAGGVYTVNAVVRNPAGEFLPGSAATLRVPDGTRAAILVPAAALVREGDLVGVRVVSGGSAALRWVRTAGDAPATGGLVEVLSGLTAGDVILAGSD